MERDTFGEIAVPSATMWGAQTQRSLQNNRLAALLLIQQHTYSSNCRNDSRTYQAANQEDAFEGILRNHLKRVVFHGIFELCPSAPTDSQNMEVPSNVADRDYQSPKVGTPAWLRCGVKRYLDSGDYDSNFTGWPGDNFVDVAQRATHCLRTALVEETLRRAHGFGSQVTLPGDLHAWTHNKLSPMVYGLFPADERSIILDTLACSVVFLTPDNIAEVLTQQTWLSTAWDLANTYLAGVGAPALSQEATDIVGLSEETTCYVSMAYFEETDPSADFVVHEAAHVFHNCKRATVGLNEGRQKEFLLNVDYYKRETFAYACEAYSRILSLAAGVRQRQAALEQHPKLSLPPDDRVDHDEYLDILRDATSAPNGWKKILRRCAPG
ncbi:hypothetical protein [Caballeronia sp. BR00000012568055]|uniref:hypothetical protein n=1 Tax=Caballeronia sp. BR00000012568055 TaxID=2918761 RepID=UPI0023F99592|nr:hypothetical protein [Caballeronia sp. BR00000012568055]